MRENNHIDFDNGVSANQFKVTIWRTIQKGEPTTQKESLKDSNTTQMSNSTVQKNDSTIQKESLKDSNAIQKSKSTIQKVLEPSQEKVLNFFREHPNATIDETVAEIKDLSLGGVKFVIGKLQQKGLLKRVGGRKHGEWQVLIDE